jgi:hypothetical protein
MRRTAAVTVLLMLLPAGCGSAAKPPVERASNRDSYRLTPEQRARVERRQAAHTGRGRAASDRPGRAALLRRAERSILGDARARVRTRELEGPVRRVTCEATRSSLVDGVPPERDPARPRGVACPAKVA